MIVVVGGQARGAGKTRAVCDIIASTREAGWVAVKVTPHRHAPKEGERTGTARYLAAGAASAHLVFGRPPVELPPARNLIVESNAILDQLEPDVLFFVADSGNPERKPSAARFAGREDAILVDRVLTNEQIEAVRRRLADANRQTNG